MTAKVKSDLPALQATGDPGGGATDAVVRAINALAAARGGGVEDGGRTIREPKTIADTYKETYRTLLRFCNVHTVDSVAPLWSRLANCGKSEQHIILTQEFQRICMSRALSTELYVPVITTALKQMITSFQFTGHGADDLGSGCNPFMVSYAGSTNHYEALAASSIGNQLDQGEQNATLSDYRRTIRNSERIKFPRDMTEVGITVTRYAILCCQGLFQGTGPNHPFVDAMWRLSVNLQNAAPFITDRYQELHHQAPNAAATYHARIVRAIQLSVYDYLQQVATNVEEGVYGIDLPTFAPMLQDLKRGTFHLSTNWVSIPEAHLDPLPTTVSRVPAPSVAATSTSLTTASTRTGVSALTADTGTRTTMVRVENTQNDAEFTSITLRPGSTRALMREHRPPRNDAGQEFCVAWWTRGGCFPNCGRSATHTAFASAGERTRLLAYVREHLQAPATSAT